MGSEKNGSDTPGRPGEPGGPGPYGPHGDGGGADRQARVARMREAEQARARRGRVLVAGASAVVAAALVVGGVLLVRAQSDDSDGSGTSGASASRTPGSGASSAGASGDAKGPGRFVTGADGVKEWRGELGRDHVTTSVEYPVVPPVGGDHHQAWMNCDGDVYTEPVHNENAVHSMEHGAVWVTYSDAADPADVAALAARVEKTPYTLMSPVKGQPDPVMMSAWGHQRTVSGAADPAVDAFFETFVQGAQTPEPGAACTGGLRR